jgi:hypothetical protein
VILVVSEHAPTFAHQPSVEAPSEPIIAGSHFASTLLYDEPKILYDVIGEFDAGGVHINEIELSVAVVTCGAVG